MDPKGASHDRRILNSWRHYSPLPDDNASLPADRTLLSFKERMATMPKVERTPETGSTKDGDAEPPSKAHGDRPATWRRRTRLERARMSPWWWMPEILSQLGAILCLTGMWN